MDDKKATELSFLEERKESIKDRLLKLMRGRSRREVAKDWGIKYPTLNNWFTRGSMPRVDIIKKIASCEMIDVNWILNGDEKQEVNSSEINKTP